MHEVTASSYSVMASAERDAIVSSIAEAVSSDFSLQPFDATVGFAPRFTHRRVGIDFSLVLGDKFRMGLSKAEERAARKICDPIPANISEMRPVRDVRVGAFLMSRTPILNNVARTFLDIEEDEDYSPTAPAFLHREDVFKIAACLGCRLPKESEWEHACRAGTTSLFVFGDELPPDEVLERWLCADSFCSERCIANAFGLIGMFTGEWCEDAFVNSYSEGAAVEEGSYVIRGGGWYFWPWQADEWIWCASAMRMPSKDLIDGRCGFRLVFDIPGEVEIPGLAGRIRLSS